ncbi:MAG: amidase, partial [Hyphomicrobiales bacterium]|nr:amidase [Hyphomicrobiales bacterium]
MPDELANLDATDARDRMARGDLSASDLCEAYLTRIVAREPDVGAFAHFDPEFVRTQAKACDDHRATGGAVGPLDGLPVGIKDIVDTRDMPTENGTPIDVGRRPAKDAVIIERLRAAGAVIMGKTVTTEFGSRHPGGTRNPHHSEHTPGGSSSGSAAAVAAGMVPLAIGTQTNGSVIRPASFCGVVGFKPSFGLIPRAGVLPQARPLDTIGVFARSITDAALIVDALAGHDPRDPDSLISPPPRLLEAASADAPATPALAFVKTPVWDAAEAATRQNFADLVAALGDTCREVPLPDSFENGDRALVTVTNVGVASTYKPYYDRATDQLSDFMRTTIEEGATISAVDYLEALEIQKALRADIDQVFERHDAIITPAAPGEAPHGLEWTGNSAFNNLWSLLGVPAITLPLLQGPTGLP